MSLEIQLNYKNGLEGKLNWVMRNKIQKKSFKRFSFSFFFKICFYLLLLFFFLFFMWVCRICDPMVGGKKYHLHKVGERNLKKIVVVVQ